MKQRVPFRIVIGLVGVLWSCIAQADSYQWLCPKCGKTWWTASPLDNHCPFSCPPRTYGKNIGQRSDSSGGGGAGGTASADSDVNWWKTRREIQQGYDQRRKNFTDFMTGLADRRRANRDELLARARNSNFDLGAALTAAYPSLPPAVQGNLQNERIRKVLSPQVLIEQLADKQEETYQAIISMINALQGPDAERELSRFWRDRASLIIRSTSSLDDKLEVNKMLYVAHIAVKAFDPQFKQHEDEMQELARRKLRGLGLNPEPFDPQKHLTPAQQQLRASVLARGQQQNQNVHVGNAAGNGVHQPACSSGAVSPQGPGLICPTQLCGGGAQSEIVTRESIDRHLASVRPMMDELAGMMTPATLSKVQNAVNLTLSSYIGRQQGHLVTQAEIDAFWNDQGWMTGSRQDVLCAAYYAVCVMTLVDPETNMKLQNKLRQASNHLN